MDEDSQDEKLLSSLTRHRGPTFSQEEVKCLINLVDKYKHIILSKSINNSACTAKEMAWTKLSETFNSQGSKHNRSTESIKFKWDNLKKEARKISRNLLDIDHEMIDETTSQIVNMLIEAENAPDIKDFSDELKVLEEEETRLPQSDTAKYWDQNTNKELNTSDDAEAKRNRSMNFTPQECSILLNCVRPEKKYIFSKNTNNKENRLKNRAWLRITNSFNKLSPYKRSTKMLQTKFTNMKKNLKRDSKSFLKNGNGKMYAALDDDDDKLIKAEPMFDLDDETEQDVDDDDQDDHPISSFNGLHSNNNSHHGAPDPLSTVLSSDSGFGFVNNDLAKYSEDKEVTKLKVELLQCQLETAKLEKERVERAMRAEALANETRAIETALRLRAARLELVSAAMKIAPDHPALAFTPEESRAQEYLSQLYHT